MRAKVNGQTVFNIFSILFVVSVGFYFIGRFLYYKLENEKEKIIPNTLASRLLEEDYGNYYESENDLSYTNGIYRYVGMASFNYVRYKGLLWRVIKINADGSVTLITENSVISLPYGDNLENHILPWLNIIEEENTGIMVASLEADQELLNTKFCIDTFSKLEEATCFHTNYDYKIGILTLDDYLEANANESYLNNGETFWTSNKYDKNNSWFISNDGRISYENTFHKYGIRPVITIDGNSTIYSGNGSYDNPYLLNNRKTITLLDGYVGDYVTYNNQVWKVVSKDNDKVKLASEECLKNKENTCIEQKYSNNSNHVENSELIIYLNNDYYQTFQYKDFLVKGPYYTGSYSLTSNDYRTTFTSTKNLTVGFLSLGEIFSYDIDNSYLMTTGPNNDLSIYSVNNHSLYQNVVTNPLFIRPVIYLNSNITITEGNGSYLSPYQLGGMKS